MAGLRGLEPRTLGLEVRCSIHWLQARQNLPETWATGSPFPETLSKALHFAPSSLLRRQRLYPLSYGRTVFFFYFNHLKNLSSLFLRLYPYW